MSYNQGMNMGKITLILVGLIIAIGSKAQQVSFAPILEEGKAWKWQHVSAINEEDNNIILVEIVGDSIVENRTCKLIKTSKIKPSGAESYGRLMPVYEENGKIYEYIDGFHPMLDMSLKIGERTPFVGFDGNPIANEYLTVVAEEYIEVRGRVFRRLQLDDGFYHDENDPKLYWVEGIGLSSDLCQISGYAMMSGWLRHEMLECSKDGELIFTKEDFDAEPCAVTEVSVEAQPANIYDLKGIKHTSPVKGLNIINGKLTFCQ